MDRFGEPGTIPLPDDCPYARQLLGLDTWPVEAFFLRPRSCWMTYSQFLGQRRRSVGQAVTLLALLI